MFTGPYFEYLWAHFQYTFTSFAISLSSPLPSLSPSHHESLRCENKFFGRWLWCSVHCVRGVCSCLCMFAAGKLWLFSVCEVYPYCFVNIYCYVRFFKISFLVTCLHICEMCLSFSAKFDVRSVLFLCVCEPLQLCEVYLSFCVNL